LNQATSNTIPFSLNARLDEFRRLLLLALPKIEQEWLWTQPNAHIPSIGVQLTHMQGNLTQYIVVNLSSSLIESNSAKQAYGAYQRQRTQEFDVRSTVSLEALAAPLLDQIQRASALIKQVSSRVWSEDYHVQTFSMTRLEACVHGIEHLNYHLGQIALLIKYYAPQDLKFYPDI